MGVQACKDFHACKWPEKLSKRDDALSVYFDNMNEKNKALIEEIRNTCRQLITFSHFLPRLVSKTFYLFDCNPIMK